MQCIPPAPPINDLKEDRLVDRIARCNPKTYSGSYDSMELKQWIRSMKKIFVVIGVPKEKKATIGIFHLTAEVNIWWNTVKDKLTGPKLT